MNKPSYLLLLVLFVSLGATADIWKWTDANGVVHFVTSKKPIYTWLDDYNRVQYADKPGHENAVSVDLVWHSASNSVEEAAEETQSSQRHLVDPNESPAERMEREQAEQYYCKRVKEIYKSYLNAPRLYETGDDGEKVYLTKEQVAAKMKETEQAVAQVCR